MGLEWISTVEGVDLFRSSVKDVAEFVAGDHYSFFNRSGQIMDRQCVEYLGPSFTKNPRTASQTGFVLHALRRGNHNAVFWPDGALFAIDPRDWETSTLFFAVLVVIEGPKSGAQDDAIIEGEDLRNSIFKEIFE